MLQTPYPLQAIRALALHAQVLDTRPGTEPQPTPETICNTVERIGCVQIDTLQMVQRSQYLVLWSRVGNYDPADFDRLIYVDKDGADGSNERRLFEYYLHAASIIPLTEYRYRLPITRWYNASSIKQEQAWLAQSGNADLMVAVQERIRREGPLRVADFEDDAPREDHWWGWKPVKGVIKILYDQGALMIANRINFHCVYDLPERVLPDWVDTTEPTPDEMRRHLVERGVRVFGICLPAQAADYAYLKRGEVKPILADLIADGTLVEVSAELADGQAHTLVVHRDNMPLLQQAADGALRPERTTFLSPFDNLLWPKDRDAQLWNSRHVLEAYKPAAKREWGYFCLPILRRDRLVGRFDPKLERKTGTLRLKALYLEPGVAPDDDLVVGVAGAMRDFMAFHQATELVIECSDPPEFGEKLLAAL